MQISDSKAQNPSVRNVYSSICNLQSAIINDLGLTFLAFLVIILSVGCGGGARVPYDSGPAYPQRTLARLGYSIQVGAFADLDNAVRLSKALKRRGLDAYYFVHETGFYKVRFGDFPTKKAARNKAEAVRAAGIIDEYYLVNPNEYAVAKQRKRGGRSYLRNEIVGTAKKFIGVPYRWGGASRREGFDCSGLTMRTIPGWNAYQAKSAVPRRPGLFCHFGWQKGFPCRHLCGQR